MFKGTLTHPSIESNKKVRGASVSPEQNEAIVGAESHAIEGAVKCVKLRFGSGYFLDSLTLAIRGPDGSLIEQTIDPYRWNATRAAAIAGPCRHSPDFRSVYWYGEVFTFTGLQAAVVSILWEAWENDTPDVGGEYLLDRAGSSRDSRLDTLFQGHAAWQTLIRSRNKGSYYLHVPDGIKPLRLRESA